MATASLPDKLERGEQLKREGVIIDVRNNNGGFVNVYAIDVLARRSYFNMQPRGFSMVPSRSALGQRSLELPTVLITNRHTLSDGDKIQVLNGCRPGEEVVVQGGVGVDDKAKVKVIDTTVKEADEDEDNAPEAPPAKDQKKDEAKPKSK